MKRRKSKSVEPVAVKLRAGRGAEDVLGLVARTGWDEEHAAAVLVELGSRALAGETAKADGVRHYVEAAARHHEQWKAAQENLSVAAAAMKAAKRAAFPGAPKGDDDPFAANVVAVDARELVKAAAAPATPVASRRRRPKGGAS